MSFVQEFFRLCGLLPKSCRGPGRWVSFQEIRSHRPSRSVRRLAQRSAEPAPFQKDRILLWRTVMNLNQVTIPQALVGVLYENGAYARTLAPGKYRLKNRLFDKVERTVTLVDVRERSITIKGQEILTADKVAIR